MIVKVLMQRVSPRSEWIQLHAFEGWNLQEKLLDVFVGGYLEVVAGQRVFGLAGYFKRFGTPGQDLDLAVLIDFNHFFVPLGRELVKYSYQGLLVWQYEIALHLVLLQLPLEPASVRKLQLEHVHVRLE